MKHGFIKLALCTPPLTLGAPDKNAKEIMRCVKEAQKKKAELAVFGRLSLTGSSLGSMARYNQLLSGAKNALNDLVAFSKTVKTAFIVGVPINAGGAVVSCAAVISDGDLIALVGESSGTAVLGNKPYTLCPDAVLHTKNGYKLSVVFEEDFDKPIPAAQRLVCGGADLIINLASSAALIDSFESRISKIKAVTDRLSCAYAYVSTGAGEAVSDNVYSGDKIAAELGAIVASFDGDSEEILYAEIDVDAVRCEKVYKGMSDDGACIEGHTCVYPLSLKDSGAELTRAINRLPFVPQGAEFDRVFDIMGRGIYTRMREAGASKLILGLSGGLDSTILLLACDRMFTKYGLRNKDIIAVMMPADASSARTKNNAAKLIQLFGVTGMEIPIQDIITLHLKRIDHSDTHDVVYENAQARERTQILLDLANKYNALMLGTGDLSETALGWSTFGGDQLAQYNPNSSLAKTLIRAMTRNYCLTTKNAEIARVLNDVLATPVSPELLPNQDTEVSVGPYELHDFFLYNLIGKGFSVTKVYALACRAFFDYAKKDIIKYLRIFITRFFTNQFKRNSACDGIQLSEFDLTHKIIHSEFNAEQFLTEVELIEKELTAKK
ncbi:MAG: NAD(+) synthase [Firmicutes bacterium]|nr:NAD(+) synthase [Bacillota bacterium]